MNEILEPNTRFSLGRWGWAWGVACGLFAGYVMWLVDPMHGRSGMLGAMVGAVLGTLLISGAFGWVAWRATGRRERGGRLVFALFCLFGAFGQLIKLGEKTGSRQELKAVEVVAREHTAKLLAVSEREPPITTAEVAAELSRLDALFATMEPRFRDRRFAQTMRRQAAHVSAFELAFAGAAGDFSAANVFDWAGLERDGDIARRRAACENYLAANRKYREALTDNMRVFRLRVEEAQLGELSAPLLKAAEQKTAKMRPAVEAFTAANEKMANTIIALLDHLDRDRTRWSIGSDATFVFETDADVAVGERHLAAISESANAVLETIKQIEGVR